jgi:hypothetical protein
MAKRETIPPAQYDPPGRRELRKWTVADRLRDYRHTFSGEAGQRVLYDILFRMCLIGSNPRPLALDHRGRPMGPLPDPNGVLLSGGVGRQEVGYEILETLSLDMDEVIDTNRRRFGNDD